MGEPREGAGEEAPLPCAPRVPARALRRPWVCGAGEAAREPAVKASVGGDGAQSRPARRASSCVGG